jgi:2-polyprenyl-6-methoxyphenol hydroxylase-like FAD-dependent oxidoreductase
VQILTNAATQHIQQVNKHLAHYHSNRRSSANTIIQRTHKTTFFTRADIFTV